MQSVFPTNLFSTDFCDEKSRDDFVTMWLMCSLRMNNSGYLLAVTDVLSLQPAVPNCCSNILRLIICRI